MLGNLKRHIHLCLSLLCTLLSMYIIIRHIKNLYVKLQCKCVRLINLIIVLKLRGRLYLYLHQLSIVVSFLKLYN